jgi:hypothetical protein
MTYTIDDKIGRHDSRDMVYISLATVSGIVSILPPSPLGRRNFIRIKNLDDIASVYLLANESDEYVANGYEIAHGDEWEENTDAPLYIITVSGLVDVQVYERATRFNYKS